MYREKTYTVHNAVIDRAGHLSTSLTRPAYQMVR